MKRTGTPYALSLLLVVQCAPGWADGEFWHSVDIGDGAWIFNTPAGYVMPDVRYPDGKMEISLEKGQGLVGYIADVIVSGTYPVYVEAQISTDTPETAVAFAVMNSVTDSYAGLDGSFNVAMPLDSDTLIGSGTLSQLITPEGGHAGIAVQAALPIYSSVASVVGVTVESVRYILSEEAGAEEFGVAIYQSSVPFTAAATEIVSTTLIVDIPLLHDAVYDATPMEMVLVTPGKFAMGSLSFERGRETDEAPVHEVEITKPFFMSRYEVTQAQWEVLMNDNPARYKGANLPVEQVSWSDCQEFIEVMNGLGQGTFRLPAEAEWEYACRAQTTTRYSFGDALDCSDLKIYCAQMDPYMWWKGNDTYNRTTSGTKAVSTKLPNPWGLYDMHGNVAEWCQDLYGDYPMEAQSDPQGATKGSKRVIRGGSWTSYAEDCRSAARDSLSYKSKKNNIGFRLVREVE